MKTLLLTGGALFLMIAAKANASVVVTYDYTYSGSEGLLPNNTNAWVWTGTGSGSNAGITPNANSGTISTSFDADVFTLVSNNGGDSVASARTWLAWNGNVWTGWEEGNMSVLEITARVNSQVTGSNYAQGFQLINSDQTMYNFYLGDGFVGFGSNLNGANMESHALNTDVFNTYQLVLTSENASLYVNGSINPVLTVSPYTNATDSYRLQFGDFNTTQGGGSVSYDTIRLANNVVIPEPSLAVLLGVGLTAFAFLKRNRRFTT